MLTDALTHLNAKGYTYEIIVVDDASKDKTTDVAMKFTEFEGKPVDIKVIKYSVNKGKGGAVRLGMLIAQGDHVLMVDADGATKFSDIDTLFKRLKESDKKNVGIVAGSRNLPRTEAVPCVEGACFKGNCVNGTCLDDINIDEKCVSEHKISHGCTKDACSDGTCLDGQCYTSKCISQGVIERSPIRRMLMGISNFIVNRICGIDMKDTQCGFKLFSKKAAKEIFTPLHLERWAFDVEAFIIAQELKYHTLEVPVTWKEIDGSNLNVVTASITMARDYLMVKFLYVSGLWTVKDSLN